MEKSNADTKTKLREEVKVIEENLTSRGNVRKPFWNMHVSSISNKLWLPMKNVCSKSEGDFLDFPANPEEDKSLCSMTVREKNDGSTTDIPSQLLETLKTAKEEIYLGDATSVSETYCWKSIYTKTSRKCS